MNRLRTRKRVNRNQFEFWLIGNSDPETPKNHDDVSQHEAAAGSEACQVSQGVPSVSLSKIEPRLFASIESIDLVSVTGRRSPHPAQTDARDPVEFFIIYPILSINPCASQISFDPCTDEDPKVPAPGPQNKCEDKQ